MSELVNRRSGCWCATPTFYDELPEMIVDYGVGWTNGLYASIFHQNNANVVFDVVVWN